MRLFNLPSTTTLHGLHSQVLLIIKDGFIRSAFVHSPHNMLSLDVLAKIEYTQLLKIWDFYD